MDDYSDEDDKMTKIIRHPKKMFSMSGTTPLKEFIHSDDLEEDNQRDVAEKAEVEASISNKK